MAVLERADQGIDRDRTREHAERLCGDSAHTGGFVSPQGVDEQGEALHILQASEATDGLHSKVRVGAGGHGAQHVDGIRRGAMSEQGDDSEQGLMREMPCRVVLLSHECVLYLAPPSILWWCAVLPTAGRRRQPPQQRLAIDDPLQAPFRIHDHQALDLMLHHQPNGMDDGLISVDCEDLGVHEIAGR